MDMVNDISANGKLLIVCAPSGGGKGTVIEKLKGADTWVSVSDTSRSARGFEQAGVHYNFISQEDFDDRRSNGYYAESNKYGTGKSYGTPKAALDEHLAKGLTCILDIDVNGAIQICRAYYDICPIAAVFLVPESLTELRQRLIGRASESLEEIDKRINTAKREYRAMIDGNSLYFDAIVLNARGQSERTAELTAQICASAKKRTSPVSKTVDDFFRMDIMLKDLGLISF